MELTTEQLTEELYLRGTDQGRSDSRELCEVLARAIFHYDVDLDFWSFDDPRGVRLKDQGGRSVGYYSVVMIDGSARCTHAVFSDVLVLVEGRLTLGWVSADEVNDLDGSFALNAKSLHPMPTTVFDFAPECPHLSVHGGVWREEDSSWECFGCGLYLRRASGKP